MLWIIKMLWYRYVLRRYRPIDQRTANVRFLVELEAHTHRDLVRDISRQIDAVAPFGVALTSRVVVQGMFECIAERVHTLCKELDRVRRSARHSAPEYLDPYSQIVDAHHKVHGTILALSRQLSDNAQSDEEFDNTARKLILCQTDLLDLFAESCKLSHSLTGAILADDVLRAGLADPYLHKRPGLAIIQIRSVGPSHGRFEVDIHLSNTMDFVIMGSFFCLLAGIMAWDHVGSGLLLIGGIPAILYITVGWGNRIRYWYNLVMWGERNLEHR